MDPNVPVLFWICLNVLWFAATSSFAGASVGVTKALVMRRRLRLDSMEAVSFMWISIEDSIFSVSVDKDRRVGIREAENMALRPAIESISMSYYFNASKSYHAAPPYSVISLLGWIRCSSASHL